MFGGMGYKDFVSVLKPKVHGTNNLFDALSNIELDFFIMLLSNTGLVGSRGQANYVAGSVFQDAFACHWARQGYPAVSIDFGGITGAGHVADNPSAVKFLEEQGLAILQLDYGLEVLGQVVGAIHVGTNPRQISVGLQINHQPKAGVPFSSDPKFCYLQDRLRGESITTAQSQGKQSLSISLSGANTVADMQTLVCDATIVRFATILGKDAKDICPSKAPSTYGADSLIAVDLQNWLYAELQAEVQSPEILSSPSFISLSMKVISRLPSSVIGTSCKEAGATVAEPTLAGRMSAMFKKYTEGLLPITQGKPIPGPENSECLKVILTGSTGSLGTYLLHELIECPRVAKIWCFNRSEDALERNRQGVRDRSFGYDLGDIPKVEHLKVYLGDQNFGLHGDKITELKQSVNLIIHNAWPVNFGLPLEAFEEPHVSGIRHLIDFSISGNRHPHIVFISSLGTISNWPRSTFFSPSNLGEDNYIRDEAGGNRLRRLFADDPQLPLPIGYAQSKYVAERVLLYASEHCGIHCTIFRPDQITGPTQGYTKWNPTEWFPSLVRLSAILSKFPDLFGLVFPHGGQRIRWVPVDITAKATLELLLYRLQHQNKIDVYHIANPELLTWESVIEPLIEYVGKQSTQQKLEVVSYQKWLQELKVYANDTRNDTKIRNLISFNLNGIKLRTRSSSR